MKYFALIYRPPRPTFPRDATPAETQIIEKHFSYLKRLHDEGVVVFAGRVEDGQFGIAVFTAVTEEMARGVLEDDPAVRAKVFNAELLPFRMSIPLAEVH